MNLQKRIWVIALQTNGHIQIVERKTDGSWVYVVRFRQHEVEEARQWVRDYLAEPGTIPTQVIDLTTEFYDIDASGKPQDPDASVVKW